MNSSQQIAAQYLGAQQAKQWTKGDPEILDEANKLELFLGSAQGMLAMEMLQACGGHVVFVEENVEGGESDVYFLDVHGLQVSFESTGYWTAYQKTPVPPPMIRKVMSAEVVYKTVIIGGKRPDTVVSTLRDQLEQIAKSLVQKGKI